MDSKLFGIDNRAALGQLFKVAFGVTPVYMTVPIGKTGEVKIEGFNPSVKEDEINEDEILKSVYGTPIIYPVQFSGSEYPVYDFYGKLIKKTFEDLWLPATTMVDFSRAKNTIKTNVLGANGTVKEYFGFDDWNIRIRMLCLTDNKYKAKEYAELITDWSRIAGSINIKGSIFTKKEIYSLSIDDIDIKTLAGSPGVIPIELSCSSDEAIEIFINSEE